MRFLHPVSLERSRRMLSIGGCITVLLLSSCGGGGGSDRSADTADTTDTAAAADQTTASTAVASTDDDGTQASEDDASGPAVDCEAAQDSLEVLGLDWQLMAAAQPGQDTKYFDDITDPNGVLVLDFDALEAAVAELRVFEPYGEETAGFLNNSLEVAGVIEAAVAGDEAARLAALDEIELITGGIENALYSQVSFGEAVAAAGC